MCHLQPLLPKKLFKILLYGYDINLLSLVILTAVKFKRIRRLLFCPRDRNGLGMQLLEISDLSWGLHHFTVKP